MKIQTLLATLSTAAFLVACAPTNPQLQAPVEVHNVTEELTPIASQPEAHPKVDILFVIDNSNSMLNHQENLRKNIDRFAEAFQADQSLDFAIGVTTVWDSRRFDGTIVTADKFHPLGQLYPVAGAAAGVTLVTRVPNYTQILGETLKIGVVPLGMGGPENEELFSPIIAAIDGRNAGFPRKDAHLAVIMITDADDVSSVSPSSLNQALLASKDGDASKFSTYAILSIGANCVRDPGNVKNSNHQILDFIKQTKGQAYDLCDSKYGDKLAEAGRLIESNASGAMKIYLKAIPESGTLQVSIVQPSADGGEPTKLMDVPYKYNSHYQMVVIDAAQVANQPADAEISVKYVPVDIDAVGTPKTKSVVETPF